METPLAPTTNYEVHGVIFLWTATNWPHISPMVPRTQLCAIVSSWHNLVTRCKTRGKLTSLLHHCLSDLRPAREVLIGCFLFLDIIFIPLILHLTTFSRFHNWSNILVEDALQTRTIWKRNLKDGSPVGNDAELKKLSKIMCRKCCIYILTKFYFLSVFVIKNNSYLLLRLCTLVWMSSVSRIWIHKRPKV